MTTAPRFRLFQANTHDEERLKQLYAEKSRDGVIQINLDRNPDFFEALKVEGFENGVFAVEDTQSGLITGAGIRNIRECYINGKPQKIGYLSGLRVAKQYQKSRTMAMIFIKLRQLYLQGECVGYLCSVFNSNKTAIKVLTSGKAGMPVFNLVGQMNTIVFKPIPVRLKVKTNAIIRQANINDIDNLVKFLNTEGSKHQYFPYYSKNDFNNNTGLLNNLSVSNIYLAFEKNEIVGSIAIWDQTPFRRWKVEGYSHFFKIFRPMVNGLFKLLNLPQLPKAQTIFNYRLLSLVCIRNNSKNIFKSIYNQAIQGINKDKKILISASFFMSDPLIHALPIRRFSFKSTIFIGYWKETQTEIDAIDQRFQYLEAGSL